MISFKNLIDINRRSEVPVFIQISNSLAHLVKRGTLAQGYKLPGSRSLSESLSVHRKTVIAAYEELMSQGWIEVQPSKGTYVSSKLPVIEPQPILINGSIISPKGKAAFHYYKRPLLKRKDAVVEDILTIDEGLPDVRIAPVQEVIRHSKNILAREYNLKYLSYGSVKGDGMLRSVLADYLHETRGLNITTENVLITRGSQMAMYLATQFVIDKGDLVIVGETNYWTANLTLKDRGAKLMTVPVDEAGVDTKAIEALCKKKTIKAIYVTPHHHHPTTVTLSAERRVHLIQLASKYGFVILEDDYDYDFHYQRAPLLPLASADTDHVVYMGAICKIVAPAYRVGYIVASKDFIDEVSYLRRIIDRQGDPVLERVIANMIKQGDIQRHTKKALKLYTERRGNFDLLLKKHLKQFVQYKIPEGGMAFWIGLDKKYDWELIRKGCLKRHLKIPEALLYDPFDLGHNYNRIGFASLNFDEQEKAILTLKEVLTSFKK